MKPDEAYGLIFTWDNVVVNLLLFIFCLKYSLKRHNLNWRPRGESKEITSLRREKKQYWEILLVLVL